MIVFQIVEEDDNKIYQGLHKSCQGACKLAIKEAKKYVDNCNKDGMNLYIDLSFDEQFKHTIKVKDRDRGELPVLTLTVNPVKVDD